MHFKKLLTRVSRWWRSAIGAGLLIAFLSGCGIDHQKETTDLADRLYEQIGSGDFPAASQLYGNAFFQRISRDRWIDTLRQVQYTLGSYERHSLIQARHQTFGPAESPGEVFTVLMYRVNYADQEAIEQLTFSTSQHPIRLVNHQIMSEMVAVNLDNADNQIQVAAATPIATPQPARAAEPVREPETEPEPPAEESLASSEEDDAIMIVARERQALEERIAAEVRRLTAVERDPELSRSVSQLTISGINPRQNRILVGLSLVKQGEPVAMNLPLTLSEVEDRRIVFQDDRGALYDKWFLTADR